MKQSHLLRNDDDRDSFIERVRKAKLPLLFEVGLPPGTKSVEQRNYFHKLMELWGKEIGESPGILKEICKAHLFGYKEAMIGGIKIVMAAGHSEKLNKVEYSQLIEIAHRLAAESGVYLPEARDDSEVY